MVRAIAVLALATVGCSDTSGLFVDVRTDFIAGLEVERVRTELAAAGGSGPALSSTLDVSATADLLGGVRVADFDVDAGSFEVVVTLLGASGMELGQRRVIVDVDSGVQRGVTVVITRSCTGVVCDGEETCEGGRCVDVRCSPENPTACPAPMCSDAAGCVAMGPACFVARCEEGVCFSVASDAACAPGQTCDPTGCVGAIADAGPDASDGGVPSATHGGWLDVVSVGPIIDATTTVRSMGRLYIAWAPMTGPGPVESYNVYRRAPGEAAPGTSLGSTDVESFTIASETAEGQTFFYTVRPVIAGVEHVTPEPFSEIRVMAPPANMVLVHRAVANRIVCERMGRPTDPAEEHSCAYSGPGSVGGRFTMPYDFLVDAFELGCAYDTTECGGPCLGVTAPGGTVSAPAGTVYYDRAGMECYLGLGGTAWTPTRGGAALMASVGSSAPGLPPVPRIAQADAQAACARLSALVDGSPIAKRLLSRREQLIAGAWPEDLTDAQILDLEDGDNLRVTQQCNTNNADGLVYDTLPVPADPETVPATSDEARPAIITGSTATQRCVSRFGAQDIVGNMWEWLSDQVENCVGSTCNGIASTLVPENRDFEGVVFDAAASGSVQGQWGMAESLAVVVPLGVPATLGAMDATPVGTGAGQIDPSSFHLDRVHLWVSWGDYRRGAIAGGRIDDPNSGVWNLNVNRMVDSRDHYQGARCAMTLP